MFVALKNKLELVFLKILRTMKGYDEYNTILLPPRQPGDKLAQEIMDSYNEHQKKKEAEDKAKAAAAESLVEGAEEGTTLEVPTIATPSGERDKEKAPSVDGEAKEGGSYALRSPGCSGESIGHFPFERHGERCGGIRHIGANGQGCVGPFIADNWRSE